MAVLAAFSVLLYRATWPLDTHLRLKLFLEIDPFYSLVSMFAARVFVAGLLLSLVTVAASLVFGRVFCGYVCPMGFALDIADRLGGKSLRTRPEKENYERGRGIGVKYWVLGASAAAAVFGFSLVFLADPLSIFTRFAALVAYPFAVLVANAGLTAIRPAADALGFLNLSHAHFIQPVFDANLFTALLFAGLLALNFFAYRAWCRYACPAGAMMGLLGWLAPWRRRVSDACNDCGLCQKRCQMGCIPENARLTRQTECIVCYSCVRVCPTGAVAFGFGPPAARAADDAVSAPPSPLDRKGRRVFIGSLVTGGVAAGILRTGIGHPTGLLDPLPLRHPRLIRPPGALPEPALAAACTRCGECMRACVTNTIQPAWLESGPAGIWTPRLVLRYAGCEQQCNVCGDVCPTGALRPLSMEEKLHVKLGTAYVVKDRCLAWEWDVKCLICDEQCPYNAITMEPLAGHKNTVPYVDEKRCNGCGFCEDKCPVDGDSAIVVDPNGEVRLASGSYVARARELGLSFKAKVKREDRYE
ncbi:MAG: 4Fe-4S binding protein [Deltaproteobacteria bacterium]|nr:4Fe-4S binding protein [Deltaproteobacteria bacterium]